MLLRHMGQDCPRSISCWLQSVQKVHLDKCRIYKSPFGQMQNLQKSIRTNAELTKVHSDKCRIYKKSIWTNAELTKVHSDKCRTYKSPFGQMQNLQKLVRNSDKCMRPILILHGSINFKCVVPQVANVVKYRSQMQIFQTFLNTIFLKEMWFQSCLSNFLMSFM